MSDGIINAVRVEGNTSYTGSIVRIQALANTASFNLAQGDMTAAENTASLHSIRWEDRDALLSYPHSSSLGDAVGSLDVTGGAINILAGDTIEGPIRQFAVRDNSNPVLVYLRRG